MNDKTLKHECACTNKHPDINKKELARVIEKECGCACGCNHSSDRQENSEFGSDNFESAYENDYSKEANLNQYENADVNFVDESNADRLESGSDIYFGEYGRYTDDGFTADNLYTMIPNPEDEEIVSTQES